MGFAEAILLGIVQGVTEFLPVSSSGHLVLLPEILGWEAPGLVFDVMLHAATLMAVLIYFRADIARMVRAAFSKDPELTDDRRLAWMVAVGTVPTVAIALLFNDFFESLFSSPGPVGAFLCVTALSLALAERLSRVSREDGASLRVPHALLIGVAQGAAVAPGISRAGATIAAGLFSGLSREQAARFSFLLSVPIIAAASAKTALDALAGGAATPPVGPMAAGALAAAVTGYLAIAGLLAYLKDRTLYPFAAYTAAIGIAVLIWQYVF